MKRTNQTDGTLYIVSTSIGNKKDITIRATEVLQNCDLIVGEEMKEASRVLMHLNLSKPIELLNEHNEKEKVGELIELLQSGKSIALISDCGTPIFADPGIELLRKALEKGINISVVPGASSIMTAIVRSGFDLKRFFYAGFLNRNSKERVKEIQNLSNFPYTFIVMDTPYRLKVLLEDFAEVMPNRRAYIGMNLTMQSETHHYGTFAELNEKFIGTRTRNEYVIVIEGFSLGKLSSIQDTLETESIEKFEIIDEPIKGNEQNSTLEFDEEHSDLIVDYIDSDTEMIDYLGEDENIEDIDEEDEEIVELIEPEKKDEKHRKERLSEREDKKKDEKSNRSEPYDRDRRSRGDRGGDRRDYQHRYRSNDKDRRRNINGGKNKRRNDNHQSPDRQRREEEEGGFRKSSNSRDEQRNRNDNYRRDNRRRDEGGSRNEGRRNRDDFRKNIDRSSKDRFQSRKSREDSYESNYNNNFEVKREKSDRTERFESREKGRRRDLDFRSSSRGGNRGDRRSNRGKNSENKSKSGNRQKRDKNK